MSEVRIKTVIDSTELDQQLVDVEARTIQTAQRQVATINRVSELSLLSLQAIGIAVDATFRIQTIAIRTVINTVIQTRAALAVSKPLLAAETVITGGVMLYLLYAQLQAIETGRAEVSAQMAASFTLLRMSGGVYL